MANSVQFQENDWAIFLDGVQVPFQSISFQSGLNGVAQISLIVEPDVLISRVRPRAVLAAFCRERYGSREFSNRQQELLGGFFYYGGGELVAIQDGKGPHNRDTQLTFTADLDILENHKGFASGIGGNAFYGQIVGTTLLNPFEVDGSGKSRDLLAFTALAQSFSRSPAEPLPDFGRHRASEGESEDFGIRMLRLISWLSATNAAVRMQCVRSRLLNKMAAVQDGTLDILANQSVAVPLFENQKTRVGSEDSMLSMIRKLQERVGYRFSTAFLPYFPDEANQPPTGNPEKVPIPDHFESQTPTPDLFKFRREWYRNDYLWLPDLFYSPPPPCNFIFPDMIGSKQTNRSFMDEPTRSIYVDSSLDLGAAIVFVEATGLVSEDLDDLLTPDQFWANFTHLMQQPAGFTAPTDSPWRSQINKEGRSINVLDQVSDEEMEKGIVLNWQQLDNEYMLALARIFQLKKPTGAWDTDKLSALRAAVAAEKGETEEEIKNKAYLTYVQEWLKYKHQLKRWNRPSQLVLKGHRWIVPGFSAIVFDTDTSYYTYVTSVNHSVDATGNENTVIGIDRTRPLTTLDASMLRKVEVTTNDSENANKTAQGRVEEVFDQDTESFFRRLDALTEDYEVIKAARDAAVNAQGADALGTLSAEIERRVQPNIRRYEENYAVIIGRAQAYADVTVGPRKGAGGALTVRTKPDLGDALLDFLDPNIDNPGSLEAFEESYAQASQAVLHIRTFNDQQVIQSSNGQPAVSVTTKIQEALGARKFTLAEEGAKLEKLIAELDAKLDFPVPPSFYNPQFLTLELLDQQYQDLLGCPPFYTGEYSRGLETTTPASGGTSKENRVRAYAEHVRAMKILSRVFPALRNSVIDPSLDVTGLLAEGDASTVSSWDTIMSAPGDDQSTMKWQHQRFLKRQAQRLDKYLETHGFTSALEPIISDEPSPTIFYRMVPTPTSAPASPVEAGNGKSYTWDESVICRIVDENMRTGEITDNPLSDAERRDAGSRLLTEAVSGVDVVEGPDVIDTGSGLVIRTVVSDAAGGTRVVETPVPETAPGPRGPDQLVKERRAKAAERKSVFLTSGFRQDQIIAYSRRHTGSRAYDGE